MFEHGFGAFGECELDLSPVRAVMSALYQAIRRQAVNQSHRTMVPDLQAFGQFAYSDGLGSRKAFDGEERLVLLRSQAGFLGGLFAEVLEPPQGIAERGQGFIFGPGHLGDNG